MPGHLAKNLKYLNIILKRPTYSSGPRIRIQIEIAGCSRRFTAPKPDAKEDNSRNLKRFFYIIQGNRKTHAEENK